MNISFKAKLLLFALLVMLLPMAALMLLFRGSFDDMTEFSLEQNRQGLIRTNREMLTFIATDQARIVSLQLQSAVTSITILGKAAQKLIDNYEPLTEVRDLYEVPLFNEQLVEMQNAITNRPTDEANVLAPPAIAESPRSVELIRVSALLNLLIGPVFESNENNSFVYFVGDRDNPITRAYPNINLATILADAGLLDFLFWREFFAEYVAPWERYYTDADLRAEVLATVGSPITFDLPYEDAAGQGKILTIFYPLWDSQRDRFAGVVAADVSLSKIVENILALQLAETGYAVLMNGEGEIIAMPEQAKRNLQVAVEEQERHGVSYLYQSIKTSQDAGVQGVMDSILGADNAFLNIRMDDGENHVMVVATLDPVNDAFYGEDQWKVLINVPEREILSTLFETHDAIVERSARIALISLGFVAVVLVVGGVLAFVMANLTIAPIRELSAGLARIRDTPDKEELRGHRIQVRTRDEIGRLGATVNEMTDALVDAAVANKDLMMGREIQKMFIPLEQDTHAGKGSTARESSEHAEIFGYYEAAKGVSGDYFDYVRLDDSHYAMIMCDVAGKGVSAGLIMVTVATIFSTYFKGWTLEKRGLRLDRLCYLVNDALLEHNFVGRFAAFTAAIVDVERGDVVVCSAGSTRLKLYRAGAGKVVSEQLANTPAAGVFSSRIIYHQSPFEQTSLLLEPGDMLMLFTDGIEESQLGAQGMDQVVNSVMSMGSATIDGVGSAADGVNAPSENDKNDHFRFDFSSCTGSAENVVMSLVSAERLLRMRKEHDGGFSEGVMVEAGIDAFLQRHFEQYPEVLERAGKSSKDTAAKVRYLHMEEDEQDDDIAILLIKKL